MRDYLYATTIAFACLLSSTAFAQADAVERAFPFGLFASQSVPSVTAEAGRSKRRQAMPLLANRLSCALRTTECEVRRTSPRRK